MKSRNIALAFVTAVNANELGDALTALSELNHTEAAAELGYSMVEHEEAIADADHFGALMALVFPTTLTDVFAELNERATALKKSSDKALVLTSLPLLQAEAERAQADAYANLPVASAPALVDALDDVTPSHTAASIMDLLELQPEKLQSAVARTARNSMFFTLANVTLLREEGTLEAEEYAAMVQVYHEVYAFISRCYFAESPYAEPMHPSEVLRLMATEATVSDADYETLSSLTHIPVKQLRAFKDQSAAQRKARILRHEAAMRAAIRAMQDAPVQTFGPNAQHFLAVLTVNAAGKAKLSAVRGMLRNAALYDLGLFPLADDLARQALAIARALEHTLPLDAVIIKTAAKAASAFALVMKTDVR